MRVQNILTDRNHPDEILVGLNARDKRVFDMHRINLVTGESKLDTENPGDVLGWATDPDFVIRVGFAQNPTDGSIVFRVRDHGDSPWRDLMKWPAEENGDFVDFTSDGKAAYVLTSIGSDVTRLVKVDLATGRELGTVAMDPRSDVQVTWLDETKHIPQVVSFNYLRRESKVLDPSIKDDFQRLGKVHAGDVSIVSGDDEDRRWIVQYEVDDGPFYFYAYDRNAKKATLLFVNRSALQHAKLAKRDPVLIEARDGVKLPSYLTTPAGVSPRKLPLVLLVHGGPWARDSWGYDTIAQ